MDAKSFCLSMALCFFSFFSSHDCLTKGFEVEEGNVIELINPKIVAFAGEQCEQEGCLSNPGAYGITKRPKAVTVRALDRYGKEFELNGTDLMARAICHECDHLDGRLYTDVQIKELKED